MEVNRFKLGLFVTLGIIFFFVILASLGVFERFQAKAYLMTMVSESVQGLSPGSAVKYQGVPIGTVRDITISTEEKLIRIDMEINLSKFKTEKIGGPAIPDISKDEFYKFIKKDIEDGMRCKLELDGITGSKYVELEFVKSDTPTDFVMEPGFDQSQIFYVPSVPSLFSDLRTSVTKLLAKFERIDYEGIMTKLSHTLDSADRLLTDPKYAEIIQNLDEASQEICKSVKNVNAELSREKMNSLITELERVMQSLDRLSDFALKEISASELPETGKAARKSFYSIEQSGKVLNDTMLKCNEGIDALIELIQYLDSDPSSLIRGKLEEKSIE